MDTLIGIPVIYIVVGRGPHSNLSILKDTIVSETGRILKMYSTPLNNLCFKQDSYFSINFCIKIP